MNMNKLYNGDCLEIMKEISDGTIDAIITDPPYGTTACKWDSVIDFKLMWEQLNRVIKPNGAIVLFGSEPFSSALRMSNIKNYKYDWIWRKNRGSNPMLAKKQPMKAHEIISVFYKKQCNYYPQMRNGKPYKKRKTASKNSSIFGLKNKSIKSNNGNGTLYPLSHIEYKREFRNQNQLHPTQKPVLLMEYLIKTYTNVNETVLDFTMGSGSTGVACKNTNRNFVGIEQDKKYFKIAEERINKKTQQNKLF
tara:strand:+ start:176 stop:925 length:750 start_codon:yes stop_codon:yes gene_type:complete